MAGVIITYRNSYLISFIWLNIKEFFWFLVEIKHH